MRPGEETNRIEDLVSIGLGGLLKLRWRSCMERVKYESLSGPRRHIALTSEEMTFLKQLSDRQPQSTISDRHRARLMKAGYVREVTRSPHSDLAATGRGLARLAFDAV